MYLFPCCFGNMVPALAQKLVYLQTAPAVKGRRRKAPLSASPIVDRAIQSHAINARQNKKPREPLPGAGSNTPCYFMKSQTGAGCRTRTRHLLITNQLLYLMS